MRAVLWDMDGTLVDSEKLWDVSLAELCEELGGHITDDLRGALVGSSAENTIVTIYEHLGLEPDRAAMTASSRWLHERTGELFVSRGLPWVEGAREMLDALAAEGVPMALVTNTERALAEQALNSIGRHYFTVTVCGDEVAQGKPAPDPYLRAADLLGVPPEDCLAIEDSATGTAAAERAGCPVLVVPNDVPVPHGPRRHHAISLAHLDVAGLRRIHTDLTAQFGERTA
jgi:HAD superfamily hydrolase (TIGR01509 family)